MLAREETDGSTLHLSENPDRTHVVHLPNEAKRGVDRMEEVLVEVEQVVALAVDLQRLA